MKSTSTQGRRVYRMLCVCACACVCVRVRERVRCSKPCGPCDPAGTLRLLFSPCSRQTFTRRVSRGLASSLRLLSEGSMRRPASRRDVPATFSPSELSVNPAPCPLASASSSRAVWTITHSRQSAALVRQVIRWPGASASTRSLASRLSLACTSVHHRAQGERPDVLPDSPHALSHARRRFRVNRRTTPARPCPLPRRTHFPRTLSPHFMRPDNHA